MVLFRAPVSRVSAAETRCREKTKYGALQDTSKSGICSKTRCREEDIA